jgi:general secretion pathway protein E
MTVEDPIEYDIDGIGQTQVNPKVDLTFARGLRAILRQDPDVVMVGEIRDAETARIAVQASMTGHLVLSTLHTNTAVGAINRLVDMGIEPFLLASSLIGVMAQRLVRKLDPELRRAVCLDVDQQAAIGVDADAPATLYRPGEDLPEGESGYAGRTGIYELVTVDQTIQSAIHRAAPESELERLARERSPGIFADGWHKALAGKTSPEEVLRVTRES